MTHAHPSNDVCASPQACYIAHAKELFQASVEAKGSVCQRSYVTIISRLLKLKKKGLNNKQLAYQLWKELEGASGVQLDGASLRTGALEACFICHTRAVLIVSLNPSLCCCCGPQA